MSPAPRRRTSRPRLESLEARLVLSWSGVPPASIAPPSNAAALTLNAQGDATGNAAITANEADYYSFVAPTTGSYRIASLTPSSNLDTVLGVFSASGSRIAHNDDVSASNTDSQVTTNLTAGNRYYVGVTNYTRTPGGSYTWLVDGPAAPSTPTAPPADDAYEDNDTRATAADLGTLGERRTINGLVMADGADWFRFTTAAAGTSASGVAISFQNAQGDLDLELYNGAGQRLRTANGTGNVESISLNGLAAGTYFVRAAGYRGATNPSYTLTVTPPAAPAPSPSTGGFNVTLRVGGMTASQQQVFARAASRWEQVIVGDLPNATYRGIAVDDILIDASGVALDGPGGVLGQAGPDAFRSGSWLPIHGTMEFDTADLAAMEADGTLYDVILHEMGHVLGIGTIWESRGLLAGAGTTGPRFTGTRATAEYNALFGTSASGVPVEGRPADEGTRDSHWRESIFGNELMSGFINSAPNPISRVTAASLADLGYTVNMAAADAYAPTAGGRSQASATASNRRTALRTTPRGHRLAHRPTADRHPRPFRMMA